MSVECASPVASAPPTSPDHAELRHKLGKKRPFAALSSSSNEERASKVRANLYSVASARFAARCLCPTYFVHMDMSPVAIYKAIHAKSLDASIVSAEWVASHPGTGSIRTEYLDALRSNPFAVVFLLRWEGQISLAQESSWFPTRAASESLREPTDVTDETAHCTRILFHFDKVPNLYDEDLSTRPLPLSAKLVSVEKFLWGPTGRESVRMTAPVERTALQEIAEYAD